MVSPVGQGAYSQVESVITVYTTFLSLLTSMISKAAFVPIPHVGKLRCKKVWSLAQGGRARLEMSQDPFSTSFGLPAQGWESGL